MDRRGFMAASLGGAVAGVAAKTALGSSVNSSGHTFQLKYAPHFGMFRHHAGPDPIDQIKFMADQGFTAMEDNGMMNRPVELQGKIAAEMERLGMQMGVFVATGDFQDVTFASNDEDMRSKYLGHLRKAVEVAKRVNAKWCTVVPGCFDPGVEWDYQTANTIDNLKRGAEILEPHGLVMVLEPLNPFRDHPGLFLTKVPQAYMICRSVGSPACKILFDIYHQQITEGNLVPNIDTAWEEIGYFQIGDNPGRNEPTTGEINYRNIFKHIHGKGYDGILGMEHGNSQPGKAGETALLEAYRSCDQF
ncbi:MAG TPA: TIM barrel protein [Acidobacteriota bacterium]|nr:TIM barrel protein [Acidobacteriota bacterium]